MIYITNSVAQSVKDKLRKISKEKNMDFNSVMRFYMYDRFIERLSKSKYRDNFILKGGFYLSNLFGISNRGTMDIDTAIRNTLFTEKNLINMVNEIINIKLDDSVNFKIEKTAPIREEDEYGGLRITINFKLENIKDKFHIDIATGDPIYHGPINYKFESLIDNKVYKVWSYNLETVLAEKIETILSKMERSSRMKDYYDIYYIYKFKFNMININNFKGATEKTFNKRNFNDDLVQNLNIIKESKILKEKWKSYSRKNSYANNIEFTEIVKYLEELINILVSTTI